jgi:hypothetical protein
MPITMNRLARNLELLAAASTWGYQFADSSAAEPAAWTTLALAGHDDFDAAHRPAWWLAEIQSPDGSVGVDAGQATPAWPTSLAVLAWNQLTVASAEPCLVEPRDRAVRWALEARGTTAAQQAHVGHDTMLTGWSWADQTHSWVEPTAMFVLALKAVGLAGHRRTREAVQLLVDRLLPGGGCNYGNTIVLGQTLVPHVQPTGLALLALAGEDVNDPRIEKSLRYLEQELSADSTTASLCFGLLGLTAHGRRPPRAEAFLGAAFDRETTGDPSVYKLALLALAWLEDVDWLSPANLQVTGAAT